MLRTLALLAAMLLAAVAGAVSCFVYVSWQINAAEAEVKLYTVAATQAFDELDKCKRRLPVWPRVP